MLPLLKELPQPYPSRHTMSSKKYRFTIYGGIRCLVRRSFSEGESRLALSRRRSLADSPPPMPMDYCSARLLVLVLIDNSRPLKRNTCDYPFFVFRARNYKHAFQRALKLGKQQQTRYKNSKGQWVRWAFVEVENVKHLGR